jgi:hypothetical protein
VLPSALTTWTDIKPTNPNEVISATLFEGMRALSPRLKLGSTRIITNFLTKHGGIPMRIQHGVDRARGWRFKPLRECREIWCREHPEHEFAHDMEDWGKEAKTDSKANGKADGVKDAGKKNLFKIFDVSAPKQAC